MARQRNAAPSEAARARVVVHIKLPTQMRNALKAVLSLEGSTMQAYFEAMAEARIAGIMPSTPARAAPTSPAPPVRQGLAPGQTYQMPTGRYIHWCAVCGNLWRTSEAHPERCGHRHCHSPYWQTGAPTEEGRPRRRGRPPRRKARWQDGLPSKGDAELVIRSEDYLARDNDVR